MRIHAVLHVTVDIDENAEPAFRRAAAQLLADRWDQPVPDAFAEQVTETVEGALSAVLASSAHWDRLAPFLSSFPGAELSALSCRPNQMRRGLDAEQPEAMLQAKLQRRRRELDGE